MALDSVDDLRESLGTRLERWLNPTRAGRPGRFAGALDDRLNLRYLAERLRHERRAIHDYVGDIRELPAGSSNLISVVTPIYGIAHRYVREFVRSVQRQSYRNWELCICVDGEPDAGIRRYLERLNAQDPNRYRLAVHDSNRGIAIATESALKTARGGIVAFADGDDTLNRDALAAVARAFANDEQIDVVYTNNDILTPWSYRIDPLYKPAWSAELLLSCNYVMHLFALRRELLDRCEGLWKPEFDGAQDWNLALRATRLARRVHHIPIVLYHWRAHENSTATRTRSKPWARDAATVIRETYLAELNGRLCWHTDDTGLLQLRFRERQAPPLLVIEIRERPDDAADPPPSPNSGYAYSGDIRVRRVLVGGGMEEQAAALDDAVDEWLRDDGLVLFACADLEDAALQGAFDTQAAFGMLPGVACVWPFFDTWRGTYTVREDLLSPRLTRSSFYTPLTGNVLTGPLHGLMIPRNAWTTLGGFRACCVEDVPRPQPIQTLGALLGLRALRRGLRNVAVRTVTSRWRPPVLDLGPCTPPFDPYV